VDAQQFSEYLLDVAVRQFAKRAERFSRTRTHLKLLTDALPFGLGLRAEHGQRSRGTGHFFGGWDA
jgi:hypothetical protein